MRTDLMSGGEPVAHLRCVHERFRSFAVAQIPFIEFADGIDDEELKGAHAMAGKGLQGVVKDIAETVIKSEDDAAFAGFVRRRASIGGADGMETGGLEFVELAFK